MITYTTTTVQECFEEIQKLFENHYKELSVTKQYKLNPDYDVYLQNAGRIRVVLCKDNNLIIGYIVFFVAPHLHYKDCLMAVEDIYYLKPEYRKGTVGIKMFKYAEKYLKSLGINLIKYSTKTHLDNTKLFEYLGCKFIEKVFIKEI